MSPSRVITKTEGDAIVPKIDIEMPEKRPIATKKISSHHDASNLLHSSYVPAVTKEQRFEFRSSSTNDATQIRTELRRERIVNRVDQIIDDRGSDLSAENSDQGDKSDNNKDQY